MIKLNISYLSNWNHNWSELPQIMTYWINASNFTDFDFWKEVKTYFLFILSLDRCSKLFSKSYWKREQNRKYLKTLYVHLVTNKFSKNIYHELVLVITIPAIPSSQKIKVRKENHFFLLKITWIPFSNSFLSKCKTKRINLQ